VLSLASKLLVLSPIDRTLVTLTRYVFTLARYDINYDVRDRGRLLYSLLVAAIPNLETQHGSWEDIDAAQTRGGVVLRREQVRVVLFEGKAGIIEKDEFDGDSPKITCPLK
jgi:AP-3 complex subunit beta